MRPVGIVVFILLAFFSKSQPNWQWAVASEQGHLQRINGMATDHENNLYLAGAFAGTITIGAQSHVAKPFAFDGFVYKMDVNGNVVWSLSFGGDNYDGFTSVAVVDDDIYLLGAFKSPSVTIGNVTLTLTGKEDCFIAKLSTSGNVSWVKKFASNFVAGQIASANSRLFLTGFNGSGVMTIGTSTYSPSQTEELHLVSLDLSGNVAWVVRAEGSGFKMLTRTLAVHGDDVYVSGTAVGSLVTVGSVTAAIAGPSQGQAAFLFSCSGSGSVKWVQAFPKALGDDLSVAAHSSGVYLGGTLASSVVLGSQTLTPENSDGLLMKLDPNGNLVWAGIEGGSGFETFDAITSGPGGQVVAFGTFLSSTMAIGSNTLINSSTSQSELFVSAHQPNGQVISAVSAGHHATYEWADCVTTDGSGNIYVGGFFSGSIAVFGNHTLPDTLTANGNYIFVAKLSGLITSVDDVKYTYAHGYKLAPNPSNGSFEILNERRLPATISVFGEAGHLIYRTASSASKIPIRLNEPPRLYIVTIRDENGIYPLKMVIQP